MHAVLLFCHASAAYCIQHTYNVTAMSFTPLELAQSIQRLLPSFRVTFAPDFRQDIARTWPVSIDDSAARQDWNWQQKYDLDVSYLLLAAMPKYYHHIWPLYALPQRFVQHFIVDFRFLPRSKWWSTCLMPSERNQPQSSIPNNSGVSDSSRPFV